MAETATVPTSRSPDLATFTLLVDGTAISPQFHLLAATVVFTANRIPWARFVFRDGDTAAETFPISEEETFAPGTEVEFKLGYHGDEETVFKGLLTRHGIVAHGRRASQLVVECRHTACKMTIVRKSRHFAEQTDADIAETLLQEYGITGEVKATEVRHAQMVQFAATDWDFLLLRARANGLLVLPRPNGLAVQPPAFDGEAVLALGYGGSLEVFEGEIEARFQPASVTAKGWDPASLEVVEATADSAGESAAGVPDAAALAEVMGNPVHTEWHAGSVATDELQAWAASRLLHHRIAKLRGRARCRGFAAVGLGDLIELAGLGARFNGRAWVSGVRHELAAGVWRTDFQLGLNPAWLGWEEQEIRTSAGLLPAPAGLQIGRIAALAGDPASGERVLVRLPLTHPDAEGVWARLATLEAGDSRGFVFRPDVDDEVLVGFLNDDPRHAVVLGAFHSGAHAAHIPADDDNPEKGYLSRGKLKLHFHDDENSITLSTKLGNQIVLSEKEKSITIADQNGNKIVLSSDGIALKSVKDITLKAAVKGAFEATNLEMKASAQAKLEGSAQAELSSGGSTAVRGSIVQIN
jgi:Rhs element Vgr protein